MSTIRRMIPNCKGFTIIEVAISLGLVGILSVFLGFFMVDFVKGYFFARTNSEVAVKAQVALDRVSAELGEMRTVANVANNSSIAFTNTTGVGRTIRYVQPLIYLNVDGTDWELLDGVLAFTLSATYDNMNGSGAAGGQVAYVDIGFTLGGIAAPFTTRVFPRKMTWP